MSYSYIQNVFPNYKTSKVYNDSLYTKIDTSNVTLDGYNEGYQNGEYKPTNVEYVVPPPETILPVPKPYISGEVPLTKLNSGDPNIEGFQNNLTYYNIPINDNKIPNYHNINLTNPIIENLTNITNDNDNDNTNQHVQLQHVLQCDQCKNILMKQFNIDSDRIKHEEIIELISYILFGLFMLYLLDSLKK